MKNEITRMKTNGRMSQVVVAGGIVYLAGQVPETPDGTVTEQTIGVLKQIDALLASAGVDKTRLLTANIWLSDARHFDEFNRVWDLWVPEGHAPTRACVQSPLMRAGFHVEIAVTALA
ncbi:endoribonuclease [Pandoraea morbifera]|uniref:Endoribonuclease n=1 Tax=Pandoraea morbifera TaxID=2508300 RepID=A0A5E4Y9Z0_9BURK|nr:RidA family protein [Pandoraea morbifera]VVE45237.1 endoribonuclease [Pandoraea morbifera]